MPALRRLPRWPATVIISLSLAALTAGSPSLTSGTPAPASTATPTLVVFITVDQMRADYFERFAPQLHGGLARLWQHGAVYTNAFHDHAITETAPGHSVVLSGRFPASTGIVMNSAGVQDPQAPLINARGAAASPFRFRGSVLMDWMRVHDPRSRGLSISRKDRGAIFPMGRARQSVFWYDYFGHFTTSTYYGDTLPTWLTQFNTTEPARKLAGTSWTLLRPVADYPEPDSVPQEAGDSGIVFPHPMPTDPDVAAQLLPNYPAMDSLTLAVAIAGARAMKLGAGPAPDLLAVSLSTTDAIGHRYGPDSREIHDQILRLDRYLGAFIDSLYAMGDSSRIIFALTADHGVAPYPGVRSHDTEANGREVIVDPALHAARVQLAAAGVDSFAARYEDGVFTVDDAMLRNARLTPAAVTSTFAAAARAIPGVERVDLVSQLSHEDTVHDAVARRWLHMLPLGTDIDATVTLDAYDVPSVDLAEHGSPHDYDAHVPVIFYGPPFATAHHAEFARVVDMAPTLAQALGVTPIERLDGHVLKNAFK